MTPRTQLPSLATELLFIYLPYFLVRNTKSFERKLRAKNGSYTLSDIFTQLKKVLFEAARLQINPAQ